MGSVTKKTLAVLGLLALLSVGSCAKEETVRTEHPIVEDVRGKRMVTTVGVPDFALVTEIDPAMPVSDVTSITDAGKEAIQSRDIPDPAIRISVELAGYLEKENGISSESSGNVESQASVDALAKKFSQVDYILDVRTGVWEIRQISEFSTKFYVAYRADIRFIDTAKRTAIARGVCDKTASKNRNRFARSELKANNAAALKAELRKVENSCIEELRRGLLPG